MPPRMSDKPKPMTGAERERRRMARLRDRANGFDRAVAALVDIANGVPDAQSYARAALLGHPPDPPDYSGPRAVSAAPDLTGQRFGRLTVRERAPTQVTPNGHTFVQWWCSCDCGAQWVRVRAAHLRCGATQSCGCLHRERVTGNHFRRDAARRNRVEM
jgi:hypothetical protein